jgi:hypothetical protein
MEGLGDGAEGKVEALKTLLTPDSSLLIPGSYTLNLHSPF